VFTGDGRLSVPFDHLALKVELDEPWLADVGFGRHSRYPIRLETPGVQADPDGKFQVVPAPYGDVDVLRDGSAEYRLELRPRTLEDFRAGCWWNSTSPESHFTRSLTCSLATPDGRVTLAEDRLIRTVGEERTETALPDDPAVLDAYRTIFNVELDRVPRLPA
jgi:N-hydroxyarylamine O-acetyltransferase